MPKPTLGTWKLADSVEHSGRACIRLQKNLHALYQLGGFDHVAVEDTLPADKLKGHTTVDTIKLTVGLLMHARSFCDAMGINFYEVNQKTWRKHFIGTQPRETKTADWKRLALQRARVLGEDPTAHDAAEAFGILDYHLHRIRVQTPWTTDDIFRQLVRK